MKVCRFPALYAFVFTGITPSLKAQVAGNPDEGFNPDVTASEVFATATQANGRILLGGVFTNVDGQTRNNLARLNPDGSLESTATFNPGSGVNGRVNSIAVQADGKILIAGDFTSVSGEARNRIARLNADGSLESTATFDPGGGPNAFVRSVVLQPGGKILIAGEFTSVDGEPRNRITRLHADGAVESIDTFDTGSGANQVVHSVAVQQDGKLLVWGRFTSWDGQARNRIARLDPDGALESSATFNPGAAADNWVWSMAVQADRKILVGGEFTTVNGQPRLRIARLNANGTLESLAGFNPGTGTNSTIRSMIVQTDGKILIAGLFTNVNSQSSNRIARLHANGTLESTATFNPGAGADSNVSTLAVQADGKILLGGAFTAIDGQPHNFFARLLNDAAVQTLTAPVNTQVQWFRGGSSPEVEQTTFDLSTDGGSVWSPLGPATRIQGGWGRTGLSLPASGHLRARGRTIGGWRPSARRSKLRATS